MTFKGFNDSKRLLDRSPYFDMLEGKKITAMLPRSWKKNHLIMASLIPSKMRHCNECKNGILCTTNNNQVYENKEFEASLNELKKHPLNEFGQCFIIIKYNFQLFVLNHLLCNLFFFFLYYIH